MAKQPNKKKDGGGQGVGYAGLKPFYPSRDSAWKIVERLRKRGCGISYREKDRWEGFCPAHTNTGPNPSLTIEINDRGYIELRCSAGCSPEAICNAVGLTLKGRPASRPVLTREQEQLFNKHRELPRGIMLHVLEKMGRNAGRRDKERDDKWFERDKERDGKWLESPLVRPMLAAVEDVMWNLAAKYDPNHPSRATFKTFLWDTACKEARKAAYRELNYRERYMPEGGFGLRSGSGDATADNDNPDEWAVVDDREPDQASRMSDHDRAEVRADLKVLRLLLPDDDGRLLDLKFGNVLDPELDGGNVRTDLEVARDLGISQQAAWERWQKIKEQLAWPLRRFKCLLADEPTTHRRRSVSRRPHAKGRTATGTKDENRQKP